MGFVYLPSWLLLAFWFMSDLAGYISQVSDYSGVAYIAHLGGQASGLLVAIIMLTLWRLFKRPEAQIRDDRNFGQVVPLTQVVDSIRRNKAF